MGNLLGSPITEKDTHTGTTLDELSIDNGGLQYGISSMQGWRVHMEDAHIAQPFLYAEKKRESQQLPRDVNQSCEAGAVEISLSNESTCNDTSVSQEVVLPNATTRATGEVDNTGKYVRIPLPNHSLFAVFDGHGGTFAAEYAARNLPRVLSRQSKFVQYAEQLRDRDCYLKGVLENLEQSAAVSGSTGMEAGNNNVDRLRLQELRQRGRESDENVKKIKERVRRHLGPTTIDGDEGTVTRNSSTQQKQQPKTKEGWWNSTATSPQRTISTTSTTTQNHFSNTNNPPSSNLNLPTTPQNNTNAMQIATAAYDHNLMTLLESSLRDAFCDLDKEIFEEVNRVNNCVTNLAVVGREDDASRADGGRNEGRGQSINSGRGGGYEIDEDRNTVYGAGFPFEKSGVGVGHLPKKGDANGSEDLVEDTTTSSLLSTSATATLEDTCQQQQQPQSLQHPCPIDDDDSGTTAAIVLLTPRWIVCANAGDSRAVYSRSNHRVVALSYDHKPEDEEEERRINDAGGYVSAGRVEGDLAVSRGLGDFRFKEEEVVLSGAQGENRDIVSHNKSAGSIASRHSSMLKPGDQKVSPVPNIIVQNRDRTEDEFIIIACDGIWDVQTNQECVNMVAGIFSEGEHDVGLICEEVLDLCLIKGSKDNMTVAIIKFPKQLVGQGGGVMARRERRGASDCQDGHNYNIR